MKANELIRVTTTALVATLSIGSIAQAGTIHRQTNNPYYISNDQHYIDLATKYPSVGHLSLYYPNAEKGQDCSGTLIRPGWVLTAAHCFEKKGTNLNGGVFQIGNEKYSLIGGVKKRQWDLALTTKTEDFTLDGEVKKRPYAYNFDIGLFALDRDVTGIAPATLYTHSDPKESFQIGTYVGFGKTGTGSTGAIKPSGQKRAGRNQIQQVGVFSKLLASDFDNPSLAYNPSYTDFFDGRATPLPDEYNIAKGDSGGGLFIGGIGNRLVSVPKLAGVISHLGFQGKKESKYGDESYSVRVADYVSWIDNVINKVVLPTSPRVIPRGNYTDSFPVEAASDEVMWDTSGLFDNLYEIQLFEDIFVDNFDPTTPTTPTPSPETVPEPSTVGTLLIGLSTLFFGKRYMRQRRK